MFAFRRKSVLDICVRKFDDVVDENLDQISSEEGKLKLQS